MTTVIFADGRIIEDRLLTYLEKHTLQPQGVKNGEV
jgi:hypothetical protein